MKCTDVRNNLPLLIYGELSAQDEAALRNHLAECVDCRRESEALGNVRRLLNTVPAPAAGVDVPRIYRAVAERQTRRLRRWRRIAFASAAVAALLLLVVGLRLQIRLQSNQIVVSWGDPPPSASVPVRPKNIVPKPTRATETEAELTVLRELVHALKHDADDRDQLLQERLERLEGHVQTLSLQADRRWDSTEENVAALYLLSRKGE